MARYPFGMNVWPSTSLMEFDGSARVGEPRASQHELDIMQVEVPSPMTILWIALPFKIACTWNASWLEW